MQGLRDKPPTRFKAQNTADFLCNTVNAEKCLRWIEEREAEITTQQDMDRLYEELHQIILDEMIALYKPLSGLKKSCKAVRYKLKEWRCESVEECWNELKKCERKHRKCAQMSQGPDQIRHEFNEAQGRFDKMVKNKKWKCLRDKIKNIENANTADPVSFWRYIQKLNPCKSKTIPMEVTIDGVKYADENTVLSHWASEFRNSLTPPPMDETKKQQLKNTTESNRRRENDNDSYNKDIKGVFTISEVGKLVTKAKSGKASGLDSIIYETVKNDEAIAALTKLFNICVDTNFVPSIWSEAIISPITKSSSTDPRVPLNYYGISLLLVISKLYTAGISNRISKYMESGRIFANEQNGLCPNRSCLDHIYTLHNAAKVRLNQKKKPFSHLSIFQKHLITFKKNIYSMNS